MMPRFIVISGVIGSGKTSFSNALSRVLDYKPIYEPVDENPYLADFYKNPARWAYPMQEHLKSMRFRLHQYAVWAIRTNALPGVVMDRSIWEDSIFAEINRDLGNISAREFDTYLAGFADMNLYLVEPDAVIYLDAPPSVCKQRADARNRPAEQDTALTKDGAEGGIPLDYLNRLATGYERWLAVVSERMPVVRVDWTEFRDVDIVWNEILSRLDERSRFTKRLRV